MDGRTDEIDNEARESNPTVVGTNTTLEKDFWRISGMFGLSTGTMSRKRSRRQKRLTETIIVSLTQEQFVCFGICRQV